MPVQTVLRQSNLKFRPEKNGCNLDKFNARLLDLKKPLQIWSHLLHVVRKMDGVRFH